jgi:AraC-like DNA-binding protein
MSAPAMSSADRRNRAAGDGARDCTMIRRRQGVAAEAQSGRAALRIAGIMRGIKTYSVSERVAGADFGIHDERAPTRIAQAHRHEYFQVQLNLAGTAQSHIGAARRELVPGSLAFVLPFRVHRIERGADARFYVINYTARFLRPELAVDPLDLEDVPVARAPELAPFLFQEYMDFRLDGADLQFAVAACRRMAEEGTRRRLFSTEIIRANLLLLIATVCRRHERRLAELAASNAHNRSRREALKRVMRHVRENLARRITLATAAAAADLSPTYLAHLIKKETGRTFIDIVTERRMEQARELLAHTALRIAEVAAAVGFEDEAYFARRFRQRFRISPSGYRSRAAAR